MNVNVLLNKEKVQRAFQFFDKDGSGSIDAEEIKEVLGLTNNQNLNKEIATIVAQVDKNGDGKLDFKEFERMLVQAQSNEEWPSMTGISHQFLEEHSLKPSFTI